MARTRTPEQHNTIEEKRKRREERRKERGKSKKKTNRENPTHLGSVKAAPITQDENGIDIIDRDLTFMNHQVGDDRLYEAKAQVKKLAGRPGQYEPSVHPRMAYLMMAHGGFTQDQLAIVFDVPQGTFLSWLHRYPALSDAIAAGRDFWNSECLEKTLYQRAMGYDYDEVEVSRVPVYDYEYDDKGKPCQVITGYEHKETKRVTKRVHPDTASLLFVLQNRRPDRWKNTRYVKVEGESTVNHKHAHAHLHHSAQIQDPAQLSTEQLEQLAQYARQAGILPDPASGEVMDAEYEPLALPETSSAEAPA